MKNLIFILLFLIGWLNIKSQTIDDFFVQLPDSSILNFSSEYRIKLVKNFITASSTKLNKAENSQGNYFIEILDIKNGYLKLGGAIEGKIEMCYWNLPDKNKLIAVYQEGCGPGCYVERFEFYLYKDSKLTLTNFKKIIPEIFSDFIKADRKTIENQMEKDDIAASLLYELPRSGKNIIAKWGNIEPANKYRKYAKGNRMILQWNNGTFKKGSIFWK